MNKKYVAECLGTFILSFAIFMAVGAGLAGGIPISVPLIAGIALGLCVYTLGPISGGHFNPAVTLGVLSIDKISRKEATGYIIFQFIGAAITCSLAVLAFHHNFLPTPTMFNWSTFIAETVGTFIFTFGVAAVIYEKTPHPFSGIIIGGSLLLGIVVASTAGSAGILNPAVALPLHSFNLTYILAPILGSILGMNAYKNLK